jgi:hypothetical protein
MTDVTDNNNFLLFADIKIIIACCLLMSCIHTIKKSEVETPLLRLIPALGCLYHVDLCCDADISEKHTSSIIRVAITCHNKQQTSL